MLKETKPFYAAAFRAESKTPENDAFYGLKKWFDENKIADIMSDYRVYGYDLPDVSKEDGTYGYEVKLGNAVLKLVFYHKQDCLKSFLLS